MWSVLARPRARARRPPTDALITARKCFPRLCGALSAEASASETSGMSQGCVKDKQDGGEEQQQRDEEEEVKENVPSPLLPPLAVLAHICSN